MSEKPKHKCGPFNCESDPDHCVTHCYADRDWLEAENKRLQAQLLAAKEAIAKKDVALGLIRVEAYGNKEWSKVVDLTAQALSIAPNPSWAEAVLEVVRAAKENCAGCDLGETLEGGDSHKNPATGSSACMNSPELRDALKLEAEHGK